MKIRMAKVQAVISRIDKTRTTSFLGCKDERSRCAIWAKHGFCDSQVTILVFYFSCVATTRSYTSEWLLVDNCIPNSDDLNFVSEIREEKLPEIL